jgi:deoxyribonuclease V
MSGATEPPLDGWRLSPREAIARQRALAREVRLQPLPAAFDVLGAADIAYVAATGQLVAVVLTFSWPQLERLESAHVIEPTNFPYIPGLLSFREIPPLLNAYRQLTQPPQVFVCDGQGLAHPRRFGLACHLGVSLRIPTVGCAKKRLCGEHDALGVERGTATPLRCQGDKVGYVLRSRNRVKPVYVSPGHLADVDSSLALVIRCLGRYRLPEPLRQAHQAAAELRRRLIG